MSAPNRASIAASIGQDAEKDWGLTPILGYDKQLGALKAKDIDGSLPIEPVTTIWGRAPIGMVPVIEMLKGEGPGIFQGVTHIQRLYTTGGLAPAEPGDFVGDEARSPYTAWYFFYR